MTPLQMQKSGVCLDHSPVSLCVCVGGGGYVVGGAYDYGVIQYDKTIEINVKTNVHEGFEFRHNNSAIAYLRWRIKE